MKPGYIVAVTVFFIILIVHRFTTDFKVKIGLSFLLSVLGFGIVNYNIGKKTSERRFLINKNK